MSKINILPQSVYNKIAAGEVVEKPYSVVKELVENAIDAGATEIEIQVEDGGTQLIRVIDNGCGIERDDLHSAFMPHATSKIERAEDLDGILTLGFRGEAIASIASISKMTIKSKVEGAKCYELKSDGGTLGEITETAGEKGTEVTVEALFFNQPVRRNFLRTARAEEADITTFVSRFILNRADISFTYYLNGVKVLQSFGEGMETALAQVYGAKTLNQCYKIDAEKNGIRIYGYIGSQNFSKSNSSYQSIFLNGRFIQNKTISGAIASAYASYLMKRQYPFYVLKITIPTEVVDVNVHPNKADVRFADNGTVYSAVFSVIHSVLDGNAKALEYVVEAPQTEENAALDSEMLPTAKTFTEEPAKKAPSISEEILRLGKEDSDGQTKQKSTSVFSDTFTYQDAKKEIQSSAPAFTARKGFIDEESWKKGFMPADQIGDVDPKSLVTMTIEEMNNRRAPKKDPEKLHKKYPDLYFKTNYLEVDDVEGNKDKKITEKQSEVDYFAENKRYLEELETKAKQNRIEISGCKYVGKLFNTYVLYERGSEVYIIDQHAAHERLIFDRLKERMKNRTIVRQPMLVPYTLKVNAFEAAFLRERLQDIRDLGFDVVESGETEFAVSSVPLDLQKINLQGFFDEILSDVGGYRGIKLEDILKDKLASAACKAAVKGGMDLTEEEIEALFALMDGNMGLKCPHGRPVVVKMTKTQLEKMFKRIV